ncbi:arsenate-mycothiol transferase ArsC [Flavobacterium restrictum]|uniref:Protein-tyrosine-phosphatase n=1 Tax=Flavobacterium restrictum TaxID=2594428 RepID=A0A553E1Y0_9FLAO|nr:protein-tyrosine-phosphatase [Flavobacterium restrictum]TRX39031.1 protein-tyrosine-phosphatase [Flavobacterium restrictum]
MQVIQSTIFPEIQETIRTFNFETIPATRQLVLQPLVAYIQDKVSQQLPVRLNLICTHNSRRSHLSQVWAQTAAAYYGIPSVFCYSGGTEATALFPVAAQTLAQQGFQIKIIAQGNNPIYAIKYDKNEPAVLGFSKTFEDDFNPQSEFAAIMTCSNADVGCPFIAGADKRIPITYDDPKAFDNTPQQAEKYQERSIQIATELFYVFSQIKK